jgi:hypothetical protein
MQFSLLAAARLFGSGFPLELTAPPKQCHGRSLSATGFRDKA